MPVIALRCINDPKSKSRLPDSGNPELIALIEAITLKQERALTELYARTMSHIYAVAYRVLRSKQDAEEIVCDTFSYIWDHAKRYDRRRCSVIGWLAVITRNRAIDRARKRRLEISMDDEQSLGWRASVIAEIKNPDEVLTQIQESMAVRSAMALLSPVHFKLVSLSFFHDFTHQEISEVLAMPQGTVKSHVRRGLIAMRTAMTPQWAPPAN